MGDDAALAALSNRPRMLYDYFKQLFAQVTNPAIDPIREELVMSLRSTLGTERNLLEEIPEHARLIALDQPVLRNEDLEKIRALAATSPRSRSRPCSRWPRARRGWRRPSGSCAPTRPERLARGRTSSS
jgi:hypothetical protein